jgi:hypothetical protein
MISSKGVGSLAAISLLSANLAFAQGAPSPVMKSGNPNPPPAAGQGSPPPYPVVPGPKKSGLNSVASTKEMRPSAQQSSSRRAGLYSNFEMVHLLDSYHDQEDLIVERAAATQARLVMGYASPGGKLEMFGTLGAIKLPNSQQVIERRPELEVDAYVEHNANLKLLTVAIAKAPFSDSTYDRQNNLVQHHGTIVQTGLRLLVEEQNIASLNWLGIYAGTEGFTNFYSRQQYVHSEPQYKDEALSLVETPSSSEPIEDSKQHFNSEASMGFTLRPSWFSGLNADLAALWKRNFSPRYLPVHGSDEGFEIEERSSYRVRMKLQLSSDVEFQNEFQQHFGGAFSRRSPTEEKRFSNVAKIAFKF